MSKVKFKWVDVGFCSIREPVYESKMAHERQENKKTNQMVKQLNRHQRNIKFTQFGKTR
ncbi:MAG: hypothetical protein J6T55_03070 [Alphaproteobacteria bacterium]|nr:hypothetical protein [Alphaproteobacteria bacterium]